MSWSGEQGFGMKPFRAKASMICHLLGTYHTCLIKRDFFHFNGHLELKRWSRASIN
ncbi:hypothetical protein KC19_4G039300 [Ceratodon purpureus]|uniref:Uncharacterized protein n=1 Tax=Ceratodon purpureus TaxID=3225 RepID=A0A8T0I8A8_CERPU|nr:hypothetical protein KC19_4G039300 [Ceratodon purpureus]